MTEEEVEAIREQFRNGEYAVSGHAIVEARKDGIEPHTIAKLEWVAIYGKVIEEYPEKDVCSMRNCRTTSFLSIL